MTHYGSNHDFIYLDRGSSHNSSSDTEASAKRQKITHKTTEVGNVQGCDKNGIIRILFVSVHISASSPGSTTVP